MLQLATAGRILLLLTDFTVLLSLVDLNGSNISEESLVVNLLGTAEADLTG